MTSQRTSSYYQRRLIVVIVTAISVLLAVLVAKWVSGASEQAYSVKITTMRGRISSYAPGTTASHRIAGPGCLGMADKYKDWYIDKPYPWPVCAMRAGCEKGSPRFGDIAMVSLGTWKTWCVILDSGPWNAINDNGDMVTASPKSKYKGKPPDGFHWRSIIDIASPSKGYPSGGEGEVRTIHFLANVKARKLIVSGNLK